MKFGGKKLLNIALIFAIMIIASIMTYSNDTLRRTRLELEEFFADELSDCEITSVVTRQYSGRGNYQLFQTNCSSKYYPILLETGIDSDEYERFQKGSIINKSANTVELTLTGPNQKELKIRHPSDEDDRFESMKIIFGFFGTGIVVMIFIPNSFWERKGK